MCAVNVGHKMHIWADLVGFQSLGDHQWALKCLILKWKIVKKNQVRSANANVHHIRDLRARVALPLPADHCRAELAHVLQDGVHSGHHLNVENLYIFVFSNLHPSHRLVLACLRDSARQCVARRGLP